MWLGSMTIEQARELEPIFAEFKGELGWVIPKWLVQLKLDIIIRDLDQKDQNTA
jgi:hypothetical protein